MFDFVFNTFWAFGNFMCLAGALVFFGLGGLMIAGWATSRFSYKRYKGTIVGVVEKESRLKKDGEGQNTIYYPLIEYTDENGTTIKATASGGSSLLSNKKPGKIVSILVDPKDPENIQASGTGLLIGGVLLGSPGILFLKFFLHGFEFNTGTAVAFVAAIAFFGGRIAKFLKSIRRDKPLTINEFQAQLRERRQKERAQNAAHVLSEYQIEDRIEEGVRQRGKAAPVFLLLGLAMLCGGGYWAYDQNELMGGALGFEGRVVDMEDRHGDDGYIYYPVVEFKNDRGETKTFTDKIGTNPPSHSRGDEVIVLYNPAFPYKPMIDRGIWNWVPQIAVSAFGALFFILGLSSIRRRNNQAL